MASHGPFWIRGVRVVSGDHAEGWVELLAALGRDPDERLSSCGIVDGRFVARIRTVSEVSRLATADADR